MTDFNKILPDWTIVTEEISNNVFLFTVQNIHGNEIEFNESDYEKGLQRCFSEAFEMEANLRKDLNKFYFDTFIKLIDKNEISEEHYDNEIFGSWYIRLNKMRIVLDGRDFELRIEIKKMHLKNDWVEKKSFNIRNGLKYSDIDLIIKEVYNAHTHNKPI